MVNFFKPISLYVFYGRPSGVLLKVWEELKSRETTGLRMTGLYMKCNTGLKWVKEGTTRRYS